MRWCGMEIIGNQARMVWEYQIACYCHSGAGKGESILLGTAEKKAHL